MSHSLSRVFLYCSLAHLSIADKNIEACRQQLQQQQAVASDESSSEELEHIQASYQECISVATSNVQPIEPVSFSPIMPQSMTMDKEVPYEINIKYLLFSSL